MEMFQVMLNYPQIHTDMIFENIPTIPLEQRAGMEKKNRAMFMDGGIDDEADLIPYTYKVRCDKQFPAWRKHRDIELVILQGSLNADISVDKITSFSLRPPELRHIFVEVGNYF